MTIRKSYVCCRFSFAINAVKICVLFVFQMPILEVQCLHRIHHFTHACNKAKLKMAEKRAQPDSIKLVF